MSLREEQCKKVCRILDDVLANRPTERDSLIVATRNAFSALSEPHWISCNERLPEKPNKTYLVTLDYGEQGRAIGQVFYHFEPIGWADSAVIAWMPLPEPFKGNDNA